MENKVIIDGEEYKEITKDEYLELLFEKRIVVAITKFHKIGDMPKPHYFKLKEDSD